MASYTTSLRLVQPATGEYSGTWGSEVNSGLTALVDNSVAGTATIIMVAADYTLSTANGASDEARAAILNVTGTPGAARNIIVPTVSKLYVVYNNTVGGFAQTVKTFAGAGVSVPNGTTAYLRCNGTDVVAAVNYLGSLTLGAALPVTSGGTGLTSPGANGNVLTSNGTIWTSSAPVAQVYPGAGLAVSTGSAWGTSKTSPSGDVVGTSDSQTLTNKTLTSYTETVFTITDGGTVNLDPNNGPIQLWTLGANRTPGQTGWVNGQSICLMVDDGTAYAITWTSLSVIWKTDFGVAPLLNTTGYTVIVLWKVGGAIYGARVGNA